MADYCRICRKQFDILDSVEYIDFEGKNESICLDCYFLFSKVKSRVIEFEGKITKNECKNRIIKNIDFSKYDKETVKNIKKYIEEIIDRDFEPMMKAEEDTVICTSKIKFCPECGKANNIKNANCTKCNFEFGSVDLSTIKIMEIKYCPNCNKAHEIDEKVCSGCGFQF